MIPPLPQKLLVLIVPSLLLPGLLALVPGDSSRADDPGRPATRIRPSGIEGSLVICGGGELPAPVINRFLELAGGRKARLVIIPTAGAQADEVDSETILRPWIKRAPRSVTLELLHTRSRTEADDSGFVEALRHATGVWFEGGDQSRIAEAYVGTRVEKELHALLGRGGVIGGTSAGAAVLSRVMIAKGHPVAVVGRGFDILPGAVIDQHFVARSRLPRLRGVLENHGGLVGLGIDEGAAAIVTGRTLRVTGRSTVTVCLAAGAGRPARETVLRPGSVADWTALRRAARARTLPPFPSAEPPVPSVSGGALVIVGGGGVPGAALRAFIQAAGGPDGLIVIIPTAMPDPIPGRLAEVTLFRRAGARNIAVLHARTPGEAEQPAFLDVLRRAGGVWFGGGRQWRLVDAYEDTKVHDLFREVLGRGGAIGGSSAGASIQADYLVRGNPLGNRQMMAEGYERGLGFLPGVAIDQHFAQRGRLPDMTRLKAAFPQLLGIGIDESTALIVRGHVARVVGRHAVRFYHRRKPTGAGQSDHQVVRAGQRYDLRARRVVGEPKRIRL